MANMCGANMSVTYYPLKSKKSYIYDLDIDLDKPFGETPCF